MRLPGNDVIDVIDVVNVMCPSHVRDVRTCNSQDERSANSNVMHCATTRAAKNLKILEDITTDYPISSHQVPVGVAA